MKFWAVFGQAGLQRKKTSYCHKYATFWGVFFNSLWAKKNRIQKKYILASAIESYILSIKANKIFENLKNISFWVKIGFRFILK